MAQQIWQLMDGLALALDQAAAYISEMGCSFSDYGEIYRLRRSMLLQERGSWFLGHPESVTTTFLLSFEKIVQNSSAAADILRICAFLYAVAIPEELLQKAGIHLGPLIVPVAADLDAWNRAISILRAYSLVQHDIRNRTLTVHRLVQAVLADSMDEPARKHWAQRPVPVVAAAFPFPGPPKLASLRRQFA